MERQQIEGHLFFDFLKTCGLENCENYQIPENMNVSLGIMALEIIRYYKKRLPERMPIEDIRILVKWIQEYTLDKRWNEDRPNKIDAGIYKKIMSEYEGSNKKIAKEYFGRDDLFLETYKEKEITDFQIEDFEKQDLVDLSVFITLKLINSGYKDLWRGEKNEIDLQIENQRLLDEIKRIRLSWIWKLIEQMRSLYARLLKGACIKDEKPP